MRAEKKQGKNRFSFADLVRPFTNLKRAGSIALLTWPFFQREKCLGGKMPFSQNSRRKDATSSILGFLKNNREFQIKYSLNPIKIVNKNYRFRWPVHRQRKAGKPIMNEKNSLN